MNENHALIFPKTENIRVLAEPKPESEPFHKPEPESEPFHEPEPESGPFYEPEPKWEPFHEPEPERFSNGSLIFHDYNGTDLSEPEPFSEPQPGNIHDVMTIVAVAAGVFGFVIMLENLVVLLCLAKGKPRQRRAINYLIGNLAVADFVAGFHLIWFMCIDFFILEYKPLMYIIGMCSLWLVSIVVSVIGLFNFALFRLKLARCTESYKLSRKTAILGIAAAWILPIALLVVPPIAGWNCNPTKYDLQTSKQHCSYLLYPFTKTYVLILAVLVIIAIISLFVIYIWMLRSVHEKVSKLKKKVTIKRKEKKMINSVLIILVMFTICILPIAICLFWDFFTTDYNLDLMTAFPVLVLLSFANSVANPFVYIWRLPQMKAALWKLVGYKGRLPEKTSFKEICRWKLSGKRRTQTKSSGFSRNKFASESSDKLSRRQTSLDTAVTLNK